MRLSNVRLQNFRRLKEVSIDLETDVSIFVGSNNSGKTSAAEALLLFTGNHRQFTIYDFNSDCWSLFDAYPASHAIDQTKTLPTTTLDLWFDVEAPDLHRVIDLLPNLDWSGSRVGLRVALEAEDAAGLIERFHAAQAKRKPASVPGADVSSVSPTAAPSPPAGAATTVSLWPQTLTDYLTRELASEYRFRYYVLDPAHFDGTTQQAGYQPLLLSGEGSGTAASVLKTLLRVDCLRAQRLSPTTDGGSRTETLSRCFGRHYKHHEVDAQQDDVALRALLEAELRLNDHLNTVFAKTLTRIASLGYPGLNDPKLVIKSALHPDAMMSQQHDTQVHYAVGALQAGVQPVTLPEDYNGLGFKNLIYIVVELLTLHKQWQRMEEERPPLHLVIIEEPEAHMHAQLQQVFIGEVLELLTESEHGSADFATQLLVTTHSAHMLYERGFKPIRYFRRGGEGSRSQHTEVLNVAAYHAGTDDRDFLERYMKLTHCDLFFADAAILVEGNAERLLMPVFIQKAAPALERAYITCLEVGGAFGHCFRSLIEFLGIPTLLIGDLDSVEVVPAATGGTEAGDVDEEDDDEEEAAPPSPAATTPEAPARKPRTRACMASVAGATTTNQLLVKWLPGKNSIAELLQATAEQRTQLPSAQSQACVRVAYQTPHDVTWRGETKSLVARTLEDAFALRNLAWCQDKARRKLGLRIPKNESLSLDTIESRVFKKVRSKNFDKTGFALGLLTEPIEGWVVPDYIAEGLTWLAQRVTPPTIPATASTSLGT